MPNVASVQHLSCGFVYPLAAACFCFLSIYINSRVSFNTFTLMSDFNYYLRVQGSYDKTSTEDSHRQNNTDAGRSYDLILYFYVGFYHCCVFI